MFVNAAFSLYRYIEKRHEMAAWKVEAVSVHELISELFKAIYSHPFFNPERFTAKKIKEYCDNGKQKYRPFRKTRLRKSIESLQSVKMT